MRFYELDWHPSGNAETCFAEEEGYNQGDAERCPACGAFISMLTWLPPYHVELDLYGKRFGDLAFAFGGNDLLVSQKFRQVYFKEWDYEVVAVRNGNAAWEVLRSADSPPLALLDWMMPGPSGVELCRKVRQESNAPFVYLVLLTGKDKTQDIVQGMESGADDYLSKPYEELELKVRLSAGKRIVELHEALRIQATRDALTGIWNRRMIFDILGRTWAHAARDGRAVGLIIADLDHFKRINDTLGHLSGDDVLVEAARRMSSVLRPYDAIGRYGGEEFLIVLPDCDQASTIAVAERMRQVINEAEVVTSTGKVPITVSLGVVVGEGPNIDANELIKIADTALYRAKRNGRNRVEIAPRPMNYVPSNFADARIAVEPTALSFRG